MKNFCFKNRFGLKIFGNIHQNKSDKLVIICHGIGGNRKDLHIKFLENYFSKKYNIISYDSSHSLGESEGNYFDATASIYYQNLEDIIVYSKTIFGTKNLILIGHSIGGLISAKYAQNHKVEKLVLISSVISGKLFEQSLGEKIVSKWKKEGFYDDLIGLESKPKLGYNFLKDLENFDILKNSKNINAKTYILVGDKDNGVPITHQKLLYEKLECEKYFYILENTSHFIKKDFQFLQLETILNKI